MLSVPDSERFVVTTGDDIEAEMHSTFMATVLEVIEAHKPIRCAMLTQKIPCPECLRLYGNANIAEHMKTKLDAYSVLVNKPQDDTGFDPNDYRTLDPNLTRLGGQA